MILSDMFDFFKKQPLEVEPLESKDIPCPCCGETSRVVWGFVRSGSATHAAYFVHWALNRPKHGARFDLIVGKWGEGSGSKERKLVSLEYRLAGAQGAFGVVDAVMRAEVAASASVALRRDQVIGKPVADEVFAIADAVFAKEKRIQEIRDWR